MLLQSAIPAYALSTCDRFPYFAYWSMILKQRLYLFTPQKCVQYCPQGYSRYELYSPLPLQALAQDQKAVLENLLLACPGLEHIQVSTYDGDTPTDLRSGQNLLFCMQSRRS
jgi:hypothetical protein